MQHLLDKKFAQVYMLKWWENDSTKYYSNATLICQATNTRSPYLLLAVSHHWCNTATATNIVINWCMTYIPTCRKVVQPPTVTGNRPHPWRTLVQSLRQCYDDEEDCDLSQSKTGHAGASQHCQTLHTHQHRLVLASTNNQSLTQ